MSTIMFKNANIIVGHTIRHPVQYADEIKVRVTSAKIMTPLKSCLRQRPSKIAELSEADAAKLQAVGAAKTAELRASTAGTGKKSQAKAAEGRWLKSLGLHVVKLSDSELTARLLAMEYTPDVQRAHAMLDASTALIEAKSAAGKERALVALNCCEVRQRAAFGRRVQIQAHPTRTWRFLRRAGELECIETVAKVETPEERVKHLEQEAAARRQRLQAAQVRAEKEAAAKAQGLSAVPDHFWSNARLFKALFN